MFKGLILFNVLGYHGFMSEKLSEKQERFIENIVQGMSRIHAAKNAGYLFPSQDAYRLMATPKIHKAVFERQMAAVTSELLPKSLRRIDEILDDTSPAPAGIKLKAAMFIVDKAAELQAMANMQDVANKNPLEMSTMELEMFVMRGRAIVSREKVNQELGIIEHDPQE